MSEPAVSPNPARTPLYGLHLELGARMVEFAGYEMPVSYPAGVIKEHTHTRTKAGLFDVSHMGQVRLTGPDAARALETLVPGDIIDLTPNQQRYTLLTNEQAGILDDLMVTNTGGSLFLVVNAACKEKDIAHLRTHLAGDCQLEVLSDRALLALQGPAAASIMEKFAPEVTRLLFMTAAPAILLGVECFISRSGYTGEDGFEISVPADRAEALARALLAHDEVEAIGLGARDSLRLEAGLCLYGHDLDTTTTPIEASLAWAVSKSRRADGVRAGGFPGADIVLRQMTEGVARKRVGILPQGKVPVREGVELFDDKNQIVGKVTSGGFGPTLGRPVSMGYVSAEHAAVGTELVAMVRGKTVPVTVARPGFVEARYFRG